MWRSGRISRDRKHPFALPISLPSPSVSSATHFLFCTYFFRFHVAIRELIFLLKTFFFPNSSQTLWLEKKWPCLFPPSSIRHDKPTPLYWTRTNNRTTANRTLDNYSTKSLPFYLSNWTFLANMPLTSRQGLNEGQGVTTFQQSVSLPQGRR